MNIATPIAGLGDNLRDPLEVEIEEVIAPFREQFGEREGEIERAQVTNEDEAGRATALAGILLDVEKNLEKKRVEMKAPFFNAGRKIDGSFGSFIETVKNAKARVVSLIDDYRAEQRRLAQAEQRRQEKIAREKEAEAAKAAAAGSALQAAKLETQAAKAAERAQEAAAPATIRSAYGQTASGRKEWKHEIIDRKKLPPSITQHPKVTEALNAVIAGAVRTGTREIPGVRIWAEEKTVIRR